MIPLNSILAIKDYLQYLPEVAAVTCGTILLIAFIHGCMKGFRKVNWMMLVCFFAFGLFVVGCKVLTRLGKMPSLPSDSYDSTAITALAIAICCVAVALVAYGLAALLFRPRWKWAVQNRTYIKNGYEYEDDEEEYDDGYEKGKTLVWKNAGKPTWFGRLLGGLICVADTAIALVMAGAVVLVGINAVSYLANSSIGSTILNHHIVSRIVPYAVRYALDFVVIAAIVLIACQGFKYGLIDGIRAVFLTLGGFVVMVVAFWLPFSSLVESGPLSIINGLTNRFIGVLSKIGSQTIRNIAGKLLTGVCLCVVLLLVLMVINFLLKRISRVIRHSPTMRKIDGCMSCVVFLIIGVLTCFDVIGIMYLIDYLNIFNVEDFFADGSLTDAIFTLCDDLLRPLLDKVKASF